MSSAVLIGGCSVSAGVIGMVGSEGKTYRGTATGYMDRTGTIDMANSDGSKCVGEFRYTGAKTGVGNLRCNDGQTAIIQFNALGMASGYGYGTTTNGTPLRFTYGLNDADSHAYLSAPPAQEQQTASIPPRPSKSKSVSSDTGFFISKRGHILTNQHVVDDCETITARLPDGTSYRAQLVASDATNDLAAVLTDSQVSNIASFGEISGYRQGDPVIVYGFPLSSALASSGTLTTGTLSALSGIGNDSRHLQISAPVQPGNSGGPLADSRGNIIGIVSGKLNAMKIANLTGDIPQNVNFAIKDVVAKSFLRAHGIPYLEDKKATTLPTADVGDILKNYVVHLRCDSN